MKRRLFTTFAIVMAVLMVLTCGAITAWAATADETQAGEGKVARIGAEGMGTYYATLEEAFSNANDRDTITVIAPTSTTSTITVTKKVTLTSENGSEVTLMNSTGAISVNGANADLIFSGNVKVTSSSSEPIYVKSGRLEVTEKATVKGNFHTICPDGSSPIEVVVSGGEVIATYTGSEIKSAIGNWNTNATINITGGKVTAAAAGAIQNAKPNAKINITGGTVSAASKTIDFKSGAGGTLTIGGDAKVKTTSGNQCINFGAAIAATTVNIEDNSTLYCKGAWAIEATKNVANDLTINITDNAVIETPGDGAIAFDTAGKATLNIEGGQLIAKGKTVYSGTNGNRAINISGGTVKTTSESSAIYCGNTAGTITLNMTGGTVQSASSDGIYKGGAASLNATISGGTISAKEYTIDVAEGTNTFDISGGTIIATGKYAIVKWGNASTNTTFNISDNAAIYAAKQAIEARGGLTFNISGGLIDVGNTYTIESEDNASAIVTFTGIVNITGGKFVLGGDVASAQMIVASDENGTTNVDGGLFVNLNTANSTIFGSQVKFTEGRVIYGDNVTAIVNGSQAAPKTLKVYYGEGDQLYNFFTKFAATDNWTYEVCEMLDGASIRLTKDSTGIRFTSEFTEVEGATYGTLIFPARYLANLTSLTKEALDAKGIKYENIIANEGMEVADGVVTIKAALTNILDDNYTTPMAAIGYMIVDGQYYYTEFNLEDNVRTIESVAKDALGDLKEEKNDKYAYAVETAEGVTKYSPYSTSQREILEGFIVAAYNVNTLQGASLMNVGNGSYALYSENVSEAAYNEYKAGLTSKGFI